MGLTDSIIETGVDKLVKLVNEKGRISSFDAAKELGVSNTVVMEWADFLEEEGIISIEYKFTKPFLVPRKLGKKEVQEKAKEFSGKKDVFVRKAEVSLSFLDREASKLNSIKDEFDKIKKELGFDLGSVKNELEELEKYERLKIDLDKQIENQKKASMDKIESMTKQVLREKRRYDDLLSDIRKEEENLEKEKIEAKSLEESEKLIQNRIEGIKQLISKVEGRLGKEVENVQGSEKNIQRLSEMAKSVKNRVEKEKGFIEPLIKESMEQSKKIQDLQERIVKKIEDKEKKLKGVKKASGRLKELFRKRMDIMNLIEKVNKDRNDLEKELIELVKKAKSFQLSSSKGDVGGQMVDMEKKFNEVNEKKKSFEKELKKLGPMLK
ncbi:hypothetical protein HYU09_05100 [Candidatus Woesearchaeota archaeon]|nr:hypothetical protein [Candidatus Woesearchaeota archaeon]